MFVCQNHMQNEWRRVSMFVSKNKKGNSINKLLSQSIIIGDDHRLVEISCMIYATGSTGAGTGVTPRSTALLVMSPFVAFEGQSREMLISIS